MTPAVEREEITVTRGNTILGNYINLDYVSHLEQQNAELVEALKFYERGDNIADRPCETYVGKCPKDADNGDVAREVLTKWGLV